MNSIKKIVSAVAAGVIMMAGAASVQAAALDTTSATVNDGVLQNFSGIDWNANGAGWIQGFGLTSTSNVGDTSTFTFTYQAFAGSIGTTSATPNLYVGSPGPMTGGYELTTFATLTETATCLTPGCTAISIITNSGSFRIFFDATPDANSAAGTGFTDGVEIISGVFTGGFSTFGATGLIGTPGTFGTGGGFLAGTVTSTNSAYVNPNLLGTTLQASLQFPGQSSPTYDRPAAFNGVATTVDNPQNFVLQTDTSQNFTAAVPEPTTTFLFGAGFLGMALYRRRKQK